MYIYRNDINQTIYLSILLCLRIFTFEPIVPQILQAPYTMSSEFCMKFLYTLRRVYGSKDEQTKLDFKLY